MVRPDRRSRIILWCLCRFVKDEALIGDLVQERGSGRSPAWFARESAAAIFLSMIVTVQNRKLASLMTMVLGYSLLYVGTVIAAPLSAVFRGWALATMPADPFRSAFLPSLWPLWLCDLVAFVPIGGLYGLAGWLVGRFNRDCRPLVLAFVMLMLFRALVTSIAAATAPLAVNRLLFVCVWTVLPTALVLAGGSLGAKPGRVNRMNIL
jgi:hypothetical protein